MVTICRMEACCSHKAEALDLLRERQTDVLRWVLAANAAMFVVELVAGLLAGSVALLADSLDMLGDALVYALSLYVVARGPFWKARAAIAKASVMGISGAFVLWQLVEKLLLREPPVHEAMGAVGLLALSVNAVCFGMLWRHRSDDVNMRSVWLCSRNDIVANGLVLLAATGVWQTGSPWPDIGVGAIISVVFLHSAFVVAREAREELVGFSTAS